MQRFRCLIVEKTCAGGMDVLAHALFHAMTEANVVGGHDNGGFASSNSQC